MFSHGERRRIALDEREHGGYFYSVNKTDGDTLYLRCKEKRLKDCRATAKIVSGQFVSEGVHSHPIDNRLIKKKGFNDALYAAVTSSLRNFRNIYDELCVRDPDGASEVPFVSAEPSMQQWRKINCAPMPTSLAHYAELLVMEPWQMLTCYGGGLNATAVRSTDMSTSIVYGDIEFLRRITTTHIYVDTTFAVCPRKPKILQLLTIMAEIDDTIIPITWALMERKSYRAYLPVLQHFSTGLAPHISPTSFMTDFESGLAAALQTTYPEAVAQRCYFHYCQALMKRAKKERILHHIRNCEDMQIVFRKIMALALLPADDIVMAFEWIVTNTPLDIAMHFTSLFEYIDRYWMNTVTPQVFSVFGMKCKTNNAVESYHRVLRRRFGVHPSIWQLTENLGDLQVIIRSSHASLDAGIAISRPSAERHVVQQEILRRAWDLYLQGLLDIPKFLACASSFLRAFNPRNLMIEANDVDHFVNPAMNGVNENRVQFLLEEDLNEIRVLRRQLEGGGEEIILLSGLRFPVCVLCNVNSADTITLPCCHWFACVGCTANLRLFAGADNTDIRCSFRLNVLGDYTYKFKIHSSDNESELFEQTNDFLAPYQSQARRFDAFVVCQKYRTLNCSGTARIRNGREYYRNTWMVAVTPAQLSAFQKIEAISDCTASNVQNIINRIDGVCSPGNFSYRLISGYARTQIDARSNQRRLLTAFGIDIDSDLLEFNQLKFTTHPCQQLLSRRVLPITQFCTSNTASSIGRTIKRFLMLLSLCDGNAFFISSVFILRGASRDFLNRRYMKTCKSHARHYSLVLSLDPELRKADIPVLLRRARLLRE